MSGLFKNLGKGVLYVIGFPFVIAGIVLTGAIGIFIFLFQLIKIIILFFQGRSIFQPLDEDIKAQAILNPPLEEEEEKNQDENKPVDDYQVYTTGSFKTTTPTSLEDKYSDDTGSFDDSLETEPRNEEEEND